MTRSLPLRILVFVLALTAGYAPAQNFPVETPANLAAPIVRAPLYECARAVHVSGFAPQALVQVYSNGTDVLATVRPHLGFADITLVRPLTIGEAITATQTVDGVESFHSFEPVIVESLPEFPGAIPPTPTISHEVYDCARVVTVDGTIPGATVIVYENGAEVGRRSATDWWTAVVTTTLTMGADIEATQVFCDNVPGASSAPSMPSPAVQVLPQPSPFLPPTVDETTVIVGNDTVTLHDLYVGAHVRVLDGMNSMGGGYSTWTTNWVPLAAPIELSWNVSGEQELCGSVGTSKPVEPTSKLAAPYIVGPVCDTDLAIRVRGGVINATIALYNGKDLIGLAGATPGDLLMAPGGAIAPGDELRVQQFLGSTMSKPSIPEPVCSCSGPWLAGKADELLSDAPAEWLPQNCGTSSVPVLDSTNPYDVIDLTLRADFETINEEASRFDAWSDGMVSYADPVSGQPVQIKARIEARGNTRFWYCGFRPLRLRFDSDPVGTIFAGTGKVIKLVTHCGFRPNEDQWIFAGTPAEHTRRVLQELATYEVIEAIGAPALNTRIARISYETPGGIHLATEYGFVRERAKRAAQRCGLVELEENEANLPSDPISEFQVQLYHKFVFSHDYILLQSHNVIRMADHSVPSQSYIPYDFDLTGVVQPSHPSNNGWTIEQNGLELIAWLEAHPDPYFAQVQVMAILQNETEIRQRIDDCPVDYLGKARLRLWLDDHLRRLKCFLN